MSDAGHHILQSVSIKVNGIQLRAWAEGDRMKFPNRITHETGRLFPPSICFQDVWPAITIDIPNAQPVGKDAVVHIGRNWMENPRLCGIGGVGASPAEPSICRDVHQFWNAIAVDVNKSRGFVTHLVDHLMLRPQSSHISWILKPGGIQAGKIND